MFQNKPFLCENPLNFPIISGALWFYYQLSPFSNYRCQKLDFQIPELYIYDARVKRSKSRSCLHDKAFELGTRQT